MQTAELGPIKEIKTPEDFLKRLKKLYGKERRELAKHLGDPPDVRNIPKKVWDQIRKDEEEAYLLLMLGFGLGFLQQWNAGLLDVEDTPADGGVLVPTDRAERQFAQIARKRAKWTSRQVVRTTKKRLRDGLRDLRDEGKKSTSGVFRRVYDDHRAEITTRTELAAARGSAARAIYDAGRRMGVDLHLIWVMRPCNHCRTCPTLHRTDFSFWGQFLEHPPLHINCCCDLDIVRGDRQELLDSGVIVEGDFKATIDAMVDDRIQIPNPKTGRLSAKSFSGHMLTKACTAAYDHDNDGLICDGTVDEEVAPEKIITQESGQALAHDMSREELSGRTLYHASRGPIVGRPRTDTYGFYLADSPENAKRGALAGGTFPMMGVSLGPANTITEYKISPDAKVFGRDIHLEGFELPEELTEQEYYELQDRIKNTKWSDNEKVQKRAATLASRVLRDAYRDEKRGDQWYLVKFKEPHENRTSGYHRIDLREDRTYAPAWEGFEHEKLTPQALRALGFDVAWVADEAGISPVAITSRALVSSVPTNQTETPEFKAWFGDSKVVNEDGSPQVVYHGTRTHFTEFETPDEGLINEMLGTHVAVDPDVTDAFTIGTYARNTTAWSATEENRLIERPNKYGHTELIEPGGQVMPMYLRMEKPYDVPTGEESGHSGRMDQRAIAIEAAATVFPQDRDGFTAFAQQSRGVTFDEAQTAWRKLNNNEPLPDFPWNITQENIEKNGGGFRAFASDYGVEFGPTIQGETWGQRMSRQFREQLQRQGYDGLRYKNTSGNEVKEDDDATAYIVFDPSQLKSAIGNRGTFSREDADITKAFDAIYTKACTAAYDHDGDGLICDGTPDEEVAPERDSGTVTPGELPSGSGVTDQTETPEFKRWFGDSKVVDEDGKPLVVYHGTDSVFTEHDPEKSTNAHTQMFEAPMMFATDSPELAAAYSVQTDPTGEGNVPTQNIQPLYMSLQRPFEVDAQGASWTDVMSQAYDNVETYRSDAEREFKQLRHETNEKYAFEIEFGEPIEFSPEEQAKHDRVHAAYTEELTSGKLRDAPVQGFVYYDGIIARNVMDRPGVEHPESTSFSPYGTVYAFFKPEQVKSAIGNRGTFSREDADITKAFDRIYTKACTAKFDGDNDGLVCDGTPDEEVAPEKTGDDYFADEALQRARDESGEYKSRSKLIYMSPDEFLQMAERLEQPSLSKQETVEGVLGDGKELNSLPFLSYTLDEETGIAQVTGHEGRHRAMALRDRGVESMPVVLRGPIRWSEQGDPNRFDRVKTWPEELRGESGGVIDFPVTDPLSAPIDQTETPEFKAWFGDSQVVNEDGKPLVVYHGTPDGDFSEFQVSKPSPYTPSPSEHIWFTDSPSVADTHSSGKTEGVEARPAVKPVYLSVQNPMEVDAGGSRWDAIPFNEPVGGGIHAPEGFRISMPGLAREARRRGYDGLVVSNVYDSNHNATSRELSTVFAVMSPEQVKSAIGNRGTFSREDADITKAFDAIYTKACTARDDRDNDGLICDGTVDEEVVSEFPDDDMAAFIREAMANDEDLFREMQEALLGDQPETAELVPQPQPEPGGLTPTQQEAVDKWERWSSPEVTKRTVNEQSNRDAFNRVLEKVEVRGSEQAWERSRSQASDAFEMIHPRMRGMVLFGLHGYVSLDSLSDLSGVPNQGGNYVAAGGYDSASRKIHAVPLSVNSGIPTAIHELGHAADFGHTKVYRTPISKTDEWISAWRQEINVPGSPLSDYATVNAQEGFAEWFRSMAENPRRTAEMFPRSTKTVLDIWSYMWES